MEIINPWASNKIRIQYFAVGKPIYQLGDYAIYQQNFSCWLYTFKNMAINQLAGVNKDHVSALFNDQRPTNNQQAFLFDRAKSNLKKAQGLNRTTFEPIK